MDLANKQTGNILDNYSSLVGVLIKDEMNGNAQHERVLVLGDTPEYLVDKAGFHPLPLAIKASVISKACFDHGVSTSFLKRLPEIIGNPKALYRSASQSESVVVLTLECKGPHPIVIPIRRNARVGRVREANFNLISSVYGKEGPDPGIKWGKLGLLICDTW